MPLVEGARERWEKHWLRWSEVRRRFPVWIQVSVGLFAAVLLFAGAHLLFSRGTAVLHVRVEHALRNGQVVVFVDDDRVYSGKLSGVARKKFGFFGETVQGTLSREIPVSSGTHRVRIQLIGSDGGLQQDSAVQEFASNSDRTLVVNARRGGLDLSWQGGITAPSANATAANHESWFSRYSTTLLMTIAGSIVSAITGFVIREIPGYLKSRQASQ